MTDVVRLTGRDSTIDPGATNSAAQNVAEETKVQSQTLESKASAQQATASAIVTLSSGVKEPPLTYSKQSLAAASTTTATATSEPLEAPAETTTSSFGGTKQGPPTP